MSCTRPDLGRLLASYELDLLDAEDRARFEEHLLCCDACFGDLYSTSSAADLMRRGPSATDEVPGAREHGVERIRPAGATFWRGPRGWALALAGVAAAALTAAIAVRVLVPPTPAPGEEPGRLRSDHREGTVVTFTPSGGGPVPRELDWKAVPGALRYEVVLSRADGQLMWREEITSPPAVIPEGVRALLTPGGVFFWSVTASGPGNTRWSSEPTRFEVWR